MISMLGHIFGHSWPLLEKWVGRSGMIMLLVAVVAAAIIWRIRAHRD